MIPPHNDTRATSDEPNSNTKTKIICPDDDNNTLNYTTKTSKKRLMLSQTPEYIRNANAVRPSWCAAKSGSRKTQTRGNAKKVTAAGKVGPF